jgi:hypothetical protein
VSRWQLLYRLVEAGPRKQTVGSGRRQDEDECNVEGHDLYLLV